jgi:hypothetical protein
MKTLEDLIRMCDALGEAIAMVDKFCNHKPEEVAESGSGFVSTLLEMLHKYQAKIDALGQ